VHQGRFWHWDGMVIKLLSDHCRDSANFLDVYLPDNFVTTSIPRDHCSSSAFDHKLLARHVEHKPVAMLKMSWSAIAHGS
jgi:hypothetical protein